MNPVSGSALARQSLANGHEWPAARLNTNTPAGIFALPFPNRRGRLACSAVVFQGAQSSRGFGMSPLLARRFSGRAGRAVRPRLLMGVGSDEQRRELAG